MEYNFNKIEQDWKKYWKDNNVYKVSNDSDKPKYYILDMFPYPSGAGLHVGHPLGYIASDIYARYKRLSGYNVLHPMGYDAFGLPAEQYALETGQHPAVTTENNIKRYREQLDNIGFCYDWSREVRTSDPQYYKWTQWIFLQLFHSWYDRKENKTRPIATLIELFEQEGNINIPSPGNDELQFDATAWKNFSEKEKREALMSYRIAYQGYAEVWWCEALGTVLANDEVVNGVSERGGHPVERKQMRQWFLRITEYAERLLSSLDTLDWSEAMKEMQRNWIGKSKGAEIAFSLTPTLSKGEGDGTQEKFSGKEGWQTADVAAYSSIAPHQKELKNSLTEAENILWQRLRNNQLGTKFRRQHIVGKFIADFISLSKQLVIEVDGKIHEQQKEEDHQRTLFFQEKGFKVIRFTNEEVIQDTDHVIEKIKTELTGHSGEKGSDDENENQGKALSFGEGLGEAVTVFTTRPDTIFGVDFIVLAPEHELVDLITTDAQKQAVADYKQYVKSRSERERMSEVKQVTGCFTGAYAIHPFTKKEIPVWIAEYVLAGYGTGAIMAVPSGDDRDHAFAKHFNIPITNIFGKLYSGEEAMSDKSAIIENSDFLTGMDVQQATDAAISALVKLGTGKRRINYKLRDAGFSRQRYWGEPFPIIYVDDVPYGTDEDIFKAHPELQKLPVELPHVDSYKPGPEGQGPLANIPDWVNTPVGQRETNTMPGYAGSSWYFLRYMDPQNDETFADRKATNYWREVDLYIGGTEHAVGHLLYSRMWTKALCDLGYISFDEPFKKLVNQGMIQGSSRFTYKLLQGGLFPVDFDPTTLPEIYISADIVERRNNGDEAANNEIIDFIKQNKGVTAIPLDKKYGYDLSEIHVDVALVDGYELNIEGFKVWRRENVNAKLLLNADGKFICSAEVEKMSKRYYNVVNPDDIVNQYGADTFRMYEMFLGPIEMSKPWDTKGIEGVHRFLKKMWRLYFDEQKGWIVTDETATEAELRVLHKTIKKITDDIERFSFNTCVSQFMICVNELSALNCHKREILEKLAVLICPFAPHMAEELWHQFGHNTSVVGAEFPKYEEQYVRENSKKYPVAVNGKTRVELEFPLDMEQSLIEKEVLADPTIVKWLEGKAPKKVIYVKGKMINVVV
ncbi:MAG: leucine--tRNA ligase [Bacteroidetes bacterium]|nr:leucine--tRNA ligase [Bacteroidota bacterium]